MTADLPDLSVPARVVPVPAHLSPGAQAFLARPGTPAAYPALADHEGWRAMIAATDEMVLSMLGPIADQAEGSVIDIDVAGCRVYVVTPTGVTDDDRRVYLQIHGGSLTSGGGPAARAMGTLTAQRMAARTWVVDYRMPPDHVYPAALDDCLSAYRALLETSAPEDIVIGGESAGGNLVAATILRARDEGLPLPAGAVLVTPELDLTESGDTFATNLGVDTVLTQSLMPANLLYAGGHDLSDPYLSPLFGDMSLGFPPTILTSGTRDLFLSNTVRMHRALRSAGIQAELHVKEAAPHAGFFGFGTEDEEMDREVRAFVAARWAAGARA